jgi:hypothetical protein
MDTTLARIVFFAVPCGLAVGALRLTGRSLWPLVVMHALNNFGGYLATGVWANASSDAARFATAGALQLGLLIVLVAYSGWFLYRHSPPGAAADRPSSARRLWLAAPMLEQGTTTL